MSTGLRERKKQQTRQHIADTAQRLFVERGFEAVKVSEIARAADVAEKTVFNYFPTKEDLFYSRMEEVEQKLLQAIRDREPGETALQAFARFFTQPPGLFVLPDTPEAAEQLRTMTRIITSSPALLARERQVLAQSAESLAALLAQETGAAPDDAAPRAAAHALIGVQRSLTDYVRGRGLAGASIGEIRRELPKQAEAAIGLLSSGLGEYARRPQ